jgi:hypothetical protein
VVLAAEPLLDGGLLTSFAPEANLGGTFHGDLSLDLADGDGRVSDFLRGAVPGDVFDVVLLRERRDGRGWERLFGGVLDVKAVSRDLKARRVRVSAWSYSKLLERTKADSITRALATKTASINNNSRVIAFLEAGNETSDLSVGDVVKLSTTTGKAGTFTIERIIDGETAVATEEASETLTDALVIVTTPFYRDLAPAVVTGLIADQLGLDLDGSDFAADLASFPIATPLSLANGSATAQPTSLVPRDTRVAASWDSADNTDRTVLDTPSGTWAALAATNQYEADWTPYLLTEPGTIYDQTPEATPAFQYDGQPQVPKFNGHFVSECVVYSGGLDSTAGDRWEIFYQYQAPDSTRIALYKNQAFVSVIEDIVNVDVGTEFTGTVHGWIEFDTFNKFPWFSYQYVPRGDTEPTVRKLGLYIGPAFLSAPQIRFLDSARSGQLRFSRPYGTNAKLLLYDCPISLEDGAAGSGELRIYDTQFMLTSFQLILHGAIAFELGYPQLWTARKWGDYLVFLFQQGDALRFAIYDTTTLALVAAYTVSNEIKSFRCYLTIMTLSDGRTVVVGYGGGEWFVVSLRYDGVIRYADFEGRSCADALVQLAAVTNSIVDVDDFRTLSLRNRRGIGRGDAVGDMGVPLEDVEWPLSEVWRSNVFVRGKLASGGDISVPFGDEADSANRLTVSSGLVSTPGMAVATGIATFQFVSAIRSQRDVLVLDEDGAPSFGNRVTLYGRAFVVYKGARDVGAETLRLTLLEYVP